MSYDFEKYREKREKVLGVKKRGMSFGTLASIVSLIIILGLGVVVVPKGIAYFATKNLDDAIYKLSDSGSWSEQTVNAVYNLKGVSKAETDNHGTRLVVTYNRLETSTEEINALFVREKVEADLLNKMDHRHRMSILKKEAEFEAP